MSKSLLGGALSLAVGISCLGQTGIAAAASGGTCTNVRLSVALAAGQATHQTLGAELCMPDVWASGTHQIDVTTPGATYNHSYYDWPQNPSLYSYTSKTLQAGRAVFNYDRIGTGNSSHPLSARVTTQTDAYVLHQAIQWLRESKGYTQINAVGHSYGSVITLQEAGTYNDASRVVITGLLHAPNPGLAKISDISYPTILDPHFTELGLGIGYLTTLPNTRSIFYDAATSDPTIVAYDNAHPDTVTATDLTTALINLESLPGVNISDHITSPVLVIVGQKDGFFCASPMIVDCSNNDAIHAYEAPYFTSTSSLTTASVPATGHDLTLSTTASQSFDTISNWIVTH